MKIMKHLIVTLALFSFCLFITTFPVSAAPQRMTDGAVFDPDYYVQNNPDVANVLGTDPETLYHHYVNHGQQEGRLPYAPGTDISNVPAKPLSAQEKKIQKIQNQITDYANQIQELWNKITTAPDSKTAFTYRSQCAACADQIIKLNRQYQQLTGMDLYTTENTIVTGTIINHPYVLHSENGDFVIAGALPAYSYTDWNSYDLLVVTPDTTGVPRSYTRTIYSQNGATQLSLLRTLGKKGYCTYVDSVYITQNETVKVTSNN